MKLKTIATLLLTFLLSLSLNSHAQTEKTLQEAFLPFETGKSSEYRSAGGSPGDDYWQNSADYEIDARLYPEEQKVNTTITIHYTNNSPQNLEFVWLKLDQNLLRKILGELN